MAKRKKRPPHLTLWFDDKETAQRACDTLDISRRKVAPLDRGKYGGNYSKMTGHFGRKVEGTSVFRVCLRFKVTFERSVYDALPEMQQDSLGYLDSSVEWISQ